MMIATPKPKTQDNDEEIASHIDYLVQFGREPYEPLEEPDGFDDDSDDD